MSEESMKMATLVSKAKASVFTLEYISQFEPADIDSDDVDLRFEVDGRDTGTNVSIVDECGHAAKVIGALVEALEKETGYASAYEAEKWHYHQLAESEGERADRAEKKAAFLKDRLSQLANFNPDWDMLEAATESLREHMAELKLAQAKIAELEDRTLKLPPARAFGEQGYQTIVKAACMDIGIKLQIEE